MMLACATFQALPAKAGTPNPSGHFRLNLPELLHQLENRFPNLKQLLPGLGDYFNREQRSGFFQSSLRRMEKIERPFQASDHKRAIRELTPIPEAIERACQLRAGDAILIEKVVQIGVL